MIYISTGIAIVMARCFHITDEGNEKTSERKEDHFTAAVYEYGCLDVYFPDV